MPYTVDDGQLGQMFAPAGNIVSATVIKDKFSGRSKGFGFVEFATAEEAQKAIEQFNGQEIEGRSLVVNVARPPKPRDDFGGGRRDR